MRLLYTFIIYALLFVACSPLLHASEDISVTSLHEEKILMKEQYQHWVPLGELRVTAYCNEAYHHICNDGTADTNASGIPQEIGWIVASDKIPMYTRIYIENVGYRVVGDYGSSDVDVLLRKHLEALEFGVKHLKVWRAP